MKPILSFIRDRGIIIEKTMINTIFPNYNIMIIITNKVDIQVKKIIQGYWFGFNFCIYQIYYLANNY